MKIYSIIITLLFSFCICLPGQGNQDLIICKVKDRYEVFGAVKGKRLLKVEDFSTAVNKSMELLDDDFGGEIKIATGLHMANSAIRLKSYVHLKGSGFGTVIVLSEKNPDGFVIIAEEADHFSVSDLTVVGNEEIPGTSGILLDHAGMGSVRNVYARDFSNYGIWLRNDCFMCDVTSCLTSGNDSSGVYLSWNNWSGRGGNAVPNLITGCKSYGEDGNAFELWRSTCNNLVGNIIYQCKGHGFYLHEQSCSNLITGNRVFSGHKNGVYCNWAPETAVTGNIFCWVKGHGIEFENVIWGTISGNNIIDNGDVIDYSTDGWETGSSYGVYLHTDTRSVQVTGNAIFNWADGHPPLIHGVYETDDCRFNNISSNNVQFYTGSPAHVNGNNSHEENNMGNPDFYTEPWLGKFRPEKPAPVQVLKSMDAARQRVDKFLMESKHQK